MVLIHHLRMLSIRCTAIGMPFIIRTIRLQNLKRSHRWLYLFPGGGEKVDVEVSKFYKTIDEVNIGAFPLRPKDAENRDLLVKFIESLIGKASIEILDESIPQRACTIPQMSQRMQNT